MGLVQTTESELHKFASKDSIMDYWAKKTSRANINELERLIDDFVSEHQTTNSELLCDYLWRVSMECVATNGWEKAFAKWKIMCHVWLKWLLSDSFQDIELSIDDDIGIGEAGELADNDLYEPDDE